LNCPSSISAGDILTYKNFCQPRGISLRMIQRHFQTIRISSGSGIQSAKIIEVIKAKMGDTMKRHATVVLPAL
jgi:hypothetical protein